MRSIGFPFDESTGYAVGERAVIYKTLDGGETWKLLTEAFKPYSLNAVHFGADGYTAIIVGEGGRIFRADEGFYSILPIESGVEEDLYSVYCDAEAKRAWVAGAHGTILRTTDGGFTWFKVKFDS